MLPLSGSASLDDLEDDDDHGYDEQDPRKIAEMESEVSDEDIINSFQTSGSSNESRQYAEFFRGVIGHGHTLRIAFDLHNVESSESPHVSFPIAQPPIGHVAPSKVAMSLIVSNLQHRGFSVTSRPWLYGFHPNRLCGWLGEYFGVLPLPLEVNSQESHRHLSISEQEALGAALVASTTAFLESDAGRALGRDQEVLLSKSGLSGTHARTQNEDPFEAIAKLRMLFREQDWESSLRKSPSP